MKALVVGASGLIGQHIVGQLRDGGHEVTAVARSARAGVDHAVDAAATTAETWRPLLSGHDGVVFAAGVDDREVPPGPAYPFFHAGNVTPVVELLTAARAEGLTRAVVLGSYFTHFNRAHPSWRLADIHPYIRSRVAQAVQGRAAAGPDLPVAVIEVPFVFGKAEDRYPTWATGLVKWAGSDSRLVAPVGGSAATTAAGVAAAAVAALLAASGADIPVVDENMTWRDMVGRLAAAAGKPRPVSSLPTFVVSAALRVGKLRNRLAGKESGLDPARLPDLMLRELFIDTDEPKSVDDGIAETVAEAVRQRG
ncbi:NAD-dependent epimerase/dehydratase family protein [Actinokineospora sp. 24-640]